MTGRRGVSLLPPRLRVGPGFVFHYRAEPAVVESAPVLQITIDYEIAALNESATILARLMTVIRERKSQPSENSYTCRLLAGGTEKIGAKITEEAAEVVEAAGEAGEEGRLHLVREAGDLLYHLLVMLAHRDAGLDEVEAELARRFGISGLDEKASRVQPAAVPMTPAEEPRS